MATARDATTITPAQRHSRKEARCPLCSGSSSLSGQSETSPCWWCCSGAEADHRWARSCSSDLWRPAVHFRTSRRLPFTTRHRGDRSLSASGPPLWNSLPEDVQSASSLTTLGCWLDLWRSPILDSCSAPSGSRPTTNCRTAGSSASSRASCSTCGNG